MKFKVISPEEGSMDILSTVQLFQKFVARTRRNLQKLNLACCKYFVQTEAIKSWLC
jgi:hypothetical protein